MKSTGSFLLVLLVVLACKTKNHNPVIDLPTMIHQDTIITDTTSVTIKTEVNPDTLDLDAGVDSLQPLIPGQKDINPLPEVKKGKGQAILDFAENVFRFDTIPDGKVIEHQFTFTNEGNRPLSIKKVEVTCGCTAPSYPFLPIEPGGSGYIGIRYNSTGKNGPQQAIATVFSDASNEIVDLVLEGYVRKKTKNN